MTSKTVNITSRVKTIMDRFPVTRDSDRELVLRYAEVYHGARRSPFDEALYMLPPIKSIERARRRVQRANPKLRASKEVQEFRKKEEQIIRSFFSQNNIINKVLKRIGL